MNKTQSESSQESVKPAQHSGIARRRLLRAGLAATPVILTLSGRSAMAAAGDACAPGLSPLAWNSLAPNGVCLQNSHTVSANTLGKSPSTWAADTTSFNLTSIKYHKFFTGNSAFSFSSGFDKNTKLSNILAQPTTIEAHLCAAYMNAQRVAGYAMSSDQVQAAHQGKIGTKAGVSQADMKAFLAQTWA